jgi:hypothetical protein
MRSDYDRTKNDFKGVNVSEEVQEMRFQHYHRRYTMMLWEIRNKTRELCTLYLFTKNHLFFREN